MKSTEVWIGRFDVRPRPGNGVLGDARGAIVNVVGLAADKSSFIGRVATAMRESDFDIILHDDVSRLCEWTKGNKLNDDLEQAVLSLSDDYPIQFDEFQAYLRDDA